MTRGGEQPEPVLRWRSFIIRRCPSRTHTLSSFQKPFPLTSGKIEGFRTFPFDREFHAAKRGLLFPLRVLLTSFSDMPVDPPPLPPAPGYRPPGPPLRPLPPRSSWNVLAPLHLFQPMRNEDPALHNPPPTPPFFISARRFHLVRHQPVSPRSFELPVIRGHTPRAFAFRRLVVLFHGFFRSNGSPFFFLALPIFRLPRRRGDYAKGSFPVCLVSTNHGCLLPERRLIPLGL